MEVDFFIKKELENAGFDMSKHIEKYLGADTYEYLFTQED
jgi:hypothetical protein